MTDPAVTVVIPVHRAVEWAAGCIESLLAQTARPNSYEIVCVFNGPEDGSRQIIEALAESHPAHRVVLLDSAANSAGAARNDGIAAARGTYCLFVDVDDRVSRDYIELMLAAVHPHRLPVAGLVDVHPDRSVDDNTAVNRSIRSKPTHLVHPAESISIAALSACKLFPTQWLQQTRFDEKLRSGEDVVLTHALLSPYARQGVVFDTTPAHRGATYRRHIVADSVSRQATSFDFNVAQRIEVIQRLTAGPNRHPDDRDRLTRELVTAQIAFIRRYLDERPDERAAVGTALADSGVPGLDLGGSLAGQDITVACLHSPPVIDGGRVVALAGRARALNRHRRMLAYLQRHGVNLHLLYFTGGLTATLRAGPGRRLRAVPGYAPGPAPAVVAQRPRLAQAYRKAGRGIGLLSDTGHQFAHHLLVPSVGLRLSAHADPVLITTLRTARQIIACDPAGLGLARRAASGSVAGRDAAVDLTGQEAQLAALVMRRAVVESRVSRPDGFAVAEAAGHLAKLAVGDPLQVSVDVWAVAALRLVRAYRFTPVEQVLGHARTLFADRWVEYGFAALAAAAEVARTGELPTDHTEVVAATMAAADQALADGDLDQVTFLTSCVLESVFNRELHTSVAHTPLVDDPDAFLAALRASASWSLLTRDSPRLLAAVNTTSALPAVTVLPGTYPKFVGGVLDRLAGRARVTVLPLAAQDVRFANMGLDPQLVHHRLLHSLGKPIPIGTARRDTLLSADIVLADWADKGAVLAGIAAAPDRLVVRFHGVDTLSVWMHLIDWGRVTDAVFVSEHLRRAVRAQLGDRLDGVREHVLPNLVDTTGTDATKRAGAERTLGMVGWAQRVKDPLWTLEVLSLLRRDDSRWRLLLIGPDFGAKGRPSEAQYATTFRQRALADDVREGIDYIGYTKHVPTHLRGVGFGISSSLRESFHLGAAEMALAGAVPVIRNWPVYAAHDGARTLYPPSWVVDSPAAAAERILAHADTSTWHQQRSVVATDARERFESDAAATAYRDVILGDPAG